MEDDKRKDQSIANARNWDFLSIRATHVPSPIVYFNTAFSVFFIQKLHRVEVTE